MIATLLSTSTLPAQACIGALAWFLLGFGFAYDADGDPNAFIGAGKSHFALSGEVFDASETNGSAPLVSFERREPPGGCRLGCLRPREGASGLGCLRP